jgi:4-hydroxybenzoate polyprenyltransferase
LYLLFQFNKTVLVKFKALWSLYRAGNGLILCIQLLFVRFTFAQTNVAAYETTLILWLVAMALVMYAGNVVNAIFDQDLDLHNKPNSVLIGKHFSTGHAWAHYFSLNFASLTIIAFLSWQWLAMFAGVILALFYYSFQLKKSFFWGNFMVASLCAAPIVFTQYAFQLNQWACMLFALFAFLVNFQREIVKDLQDQAGDKLFGAQTLAIIWGKNRSLQLVRCLYVVLLLALPMYWKYSTDRGSLVALALLFLAIVHGFWASYLFQEKISKLSLHLKLSMLWGLVSMLFWHF